MDITESCKWVLRDLDSNTVSSTRECLFGGELNCDYLPKCLSFDIQHVSNEHRYEVIIYRAIDTIYYGTQTINICIFH